MADSALSEAHNITAGRMTRRYWLGFLALCLLGSSAWLVEAAWPSLMPTASRECLHYLVITFAVGIFGWKKIARSRFRSTPVAKLAAASVCLYGIPAALIESARSGVSEATIAALFALLPVAVVLSVPQFDFGERVNSATTSVLAPALIGLAGMMLLLPFALPASFGEVRWYAVVVLAVLIAATASVWMYRLLVEVSLIEATVICSIANATFLLAFALAWIAISGTSWAAEWSWNALNVEVLKAVCLDMPQIILLLWLMRDVAPERLAARALVIPLFTVLEGYALLRPQVSLRSVGGAVLLLFGSWRLLSGRQRDEEPGLMLR